MSQEQVPLPGPESLEEGRRRARVPVAPGTTYHDLHVTTAEIPRTRLFDLPYGLEVTCARTTGWQLWQTHSDIRQWKLLAGEYDGPDKWLILDVAGHVIVNSRDRERGQDHGTS